MSLLVDKAYECYCPILKDNVEVDNHAAVEECEGGAWIQAWLFVPAKGALYHNELLAACKAVVANWESGDLAGAVRNLSNLIGK
jgi:hypothetical protein